MPDTIDQPTRGLVDDAAHQAELDSTRQLILNAAELLPTQGPINAYVFLNMLQGLEEMKFEDGVRRGLQLFGCQSYLTEDQYREKLARGRIRPEDLDAVLREDLGERSDESIAGLTTRFQLRRMMLEHRLCAGPAEELRWFVAETDALTHIRDDVPTTTREKFIEETRHWVMRDLRNGHSERRADEPGHGLSDPFGVTELVARTGASSIERWSQATWESLSLQALWRICRAGVQDVPTAAPPIMAIRPRDGLLQATGVDSDVLVNELLVRFCAAFADQGFAPWALPYRNLGFYRAFLAVNRQSAGPPDLWRAELPAELARIDDSGMSAIESVVESIHLLGISPDELNDFIPLSILALRGWAGLVWQMESRGDRVPLPAPDGSLVEFLAIRLVLERVALQYLARNHFDFTGPLADLRSFMRGKVTPTPATSHELRAFLIFQLAQLFGWCPPRLVQLSPDDWKQLVSEIDFFAGLEARRMFHFAFERNYRIRALDALSIHTRGTAERVRAPRFQATFCIDAREESFRRHLEEIAPDVETYAYAGFYGIAIYYRGVADAHFSTLCPIVVRPQHWVVEDVVYSLADSHRRRAATRKALGTASHQVHVGSRSIAGGALLTAGLGVLASFPLVARVLFPLLTARIRRTAGHWVEPPAVTRLRLERSTPNPGPEDDQVGFNLEEMAFRGEKMLRDMGLTSNFARLVIFFGHGSKCLNNPHKSAYDCGACSGSAGGPNARALAAMLNDPRVRKILAEHGLEIPADTIFLGGMHNTAEDSLWFYDLDLLPKSHHKDFEAARATLEQACELNAQERCRRFDSAPLNLTPAAARRHVENRAEDLAQTRPEFGNATNAMTIVGRRERLRGLYMDRRSFLHSYDPTQDDEKATILGRILAAVVPVCAGINLQYFFSYMDNSGWGSGTKLPHNVTSLLGVMDGSASDLRSGLPWQGVEIHEPLRLLMVFESTPTALNQIMDRDPVVARNIRNGWVQVALLNPYSNELRVYRHGQYLLYQPETFELPRARRSADWFRGWRDHLGFAQIGDAPTTSASNR